MASIDVTLNQNQLSLVGDLKFYNVMSAYADSIKLLNTLVTNDTSKGYQSRPEVIIDFSHVKSSDSSGLALLIEWIKLAKQKQFSVRFTNLSDDIISIARVAGIDKLITNKNFKQ